MRRCERRVLLRLVAVLLRVLAVCLLVDEVDEVVHMKRFSVHPSRRAERGKEWAVVVGEGGLDLGRELVVGDASSLFRELLLELHHGGDVSLHIFVFVTAAVGELCEVVGVRALFLDTIRFSLQFYKDFLLTFTNRRM
jgi:hypothetical protein